DLVHRARVKGEGPGALPPGRHTVEVDFKYAGIGVGTLAYNNFSGLAQPGTGTLKIDGKVVATRKLEKTLPAILQWDESFDIGSDTLTGVNDADYKPPFPLTAKFNKLTIKVDRPQLSPEDIKKLDAAMKEKAKGGLSRLDAPTLLPFRGRPRRWDEGPTSPPSAREAPSGGRSGVSVR